MFPRPVAGPLRPVVQAPTKKYNAKARLGRGFTLDELKAASLSAAFARTIGIAVDSRRKNRSEEALARNVARLNEYKAKLVLFPRKADKPKKGDASADDVAAASQLTGALLPIDRTPAAVEYRAVAADAKDASAFNRLRRERSFTKKVRLHTHCNSSK